MDKKIRKTAFGFTLIELIIAILIFSVVMGGMYSFLHQANTASSKAFSRQDLVNQSNYIMKQMQDDFRMAASAAILMNSEAADVKIVQLLNNKESKVSYNWNKPALVRKVEFGGQTTIHKFSNNVENFLVEKKLRPSIDPNDVQAANEQVLIKLELSSWVPGSAKPLLHEQHAMATMRDVSSLKYDPHWRDVGNMKGAFSSYGDLLQSLTEDAKLLVEDITKSTESLVKDAENAANDALNQNVKNLQQAKTQINTALGEIKKGKIDLSHSLDDMQKNMESMPTDIFDREVSRPGTWFGSKDDALKRVQNAFMNMKTVEDCDVSKLEAAADPFKLNDAFRQFMKSKKEALENKVKMDNNQTKLEGLLDKVEEKMGSSGG